MRQGACLVHAGSHDRDLTGVGLWAESERGSCCGSSKAWALEPDSLDSSTFSSTPFCATVASYFTLLCLIFARPTSECCGNPLLARAWHGGATGSLVSEVHLWIQAAA